MGRIKFVKTVEDSLNKGCSEVVLVDREYHMKELADVQRVFEKRNYETSLVNKMSAVTRTSYNKLTIYNIINQN